MINEAPTAETAGTSSAYEANGLSVAMDWNPNQPGRLWATVTTEHYRRLDQLTDAETGHIVRNAKDFTEYARIYWGMIL